MKSKSDCLIVLAKEKGYTADRQGNIFTPEGNKLVGSRSKTGHLNFIPNVVERSKRSSVLAHRFIAYYFFGEELFKHPLVRHLNDDPSDNRLCNLALGSHKDNRADIPKEKLSLIAKTNAPALVERSRKLTNEDVLSMRKERELTKMSYKKLGDVYGVGAMTAYRTVNKQSWSNV